jgi:PAS domain S-box-containing protein
MRSFNSEETRIILDTLAEGVFTVDTNRVITFFNRAAEQITGIKRTEAVGRPCWEIIKADICGRYCLLQRTLESGEPIAHSSVSIVNAEGTRVPVSISTTLLKDRNGKVIGGVETFRDISVEEQLRHEISGTRTGGELVSKNDTMLRLFDVLKTAALDDSPVLLEGEHGTGKHLFARVLHSLSLRKETPLITFCCSTLPESLMERELFDRRRQDPGRTFQQTGGKLAQAQGGTIFLDDIHRLPSRLQLRLLRALEENRSDPANTLPSSAVGLRLIAGTESELSATVDRGGFSNELYRMISRVTLRIPPLRDRLEDVPLLVDHFVRKFNSLTGKEIAQVEPEAMNILMTYRYPGNVKELEKIVEYAAVVCENRQIRTDHLPEHLLLARVGSRGLQSGRSNASGESMLEVEHRFIRQALMRNNWNRKATAEEMGIHPTTLWRKMKRLGIKAPTTKMLQRSP